MDMFVKRKRALLIILSAMLAFSSACGAGGRAAKASAETTDASADAGYDTANPAAGKTAGTECRE